MVCPTSADSGPAAFVKLAKTQRFLTESSASGGVCCFFAGDISQTAICSLPMPFPCFLKRRNRNRAIRCRRSLNSRRNLPDRCRQLQGPDHLSTDFFQLPSTPSLTENPIERSRCGIRHPPSDAKPPEPSGPFLTGMILWPSRSPIHAEKFRRH